MKIIGLCGGSGSGKGTVAELFSVYGIPSVDTDALYHNMTSSKSPCLDAIVEAFGNGILNSDGSLNRQALAEIVFTGENSASKRALLNKISHSFVLAETRKIIDFMQTGGAEYLLLDVPLLFESGFDKLCDIIVSVIASNEVRIKRIVLRDNISEEKAGVRIKSQLPNEYLIENSNYQINNNGTFEELSYAVASVAEKILNLKENPNG